MIRANKWLNTSVFQEAAIYFRENGVYTFLEEGSDEWFSFWQEELRRCREGYEVDGERITGHHYYFLNYSRMQKTDVEKKRKYNDFPDFWDAHYDFFWIVEIARNGISFEDLKSLKLKCKPLWLDGGHHVILGKARRKGMSYANAAIVTNVYNTIPNSLSLICSFDKKYCMDTMNKVRDNLDWLSEHTPFGKKREYYDRKDWIRASYKEQSGGIYIEKGYKSEVRALTFKDNPDAARGKDANLVLLEEIGTYSNLKDSFGTTKPSVEDGAVTTGQIIAYGTSSLDIEVKTADMADMYYDPETHNFIPFKNTWDEDSGDRSVGWFFPVYQSYVGYMDKWGNSDIEAAKERENKRRADILRRSNSPAALQSHIIEFPFSPEEAFLQSNINGFPVRELKRQLNKVMTDDLYRKKGQACHIYRESGKVILKPDLKGELEPVIHFPPKNKDVTGCPVIFEFPINEPPKGLYKIGYDPYRQDQSNEPSLAAAIVYKSFNSLSLSGDCIVAEYIGRPQTYDEANRIVLLLAEAYNAEVMHENEVTSVKSYFQRKKKLDYLAAQPDAVIKANIKNSTVSRSYGIHMPAKLKDAAEKYITKWLLEESVDITGQKLLNLEKIYSIGLLEELIRYNRTKGNFDRIIALGMVMFMIENEEEGKKYGGESRMNIIIDQLYSKRRKNWKTLSIG